MKSNGNVKHGYRGELQIDHKNGVIEFFTWDRQVRLLRITHLPEPIPAGTYVDLVALEALTSYTPVAHGNDGPPVERIKDAPQA